MAPLPDNLTDRYFIDYEGVAGKHTIMFRFGTEVTYADAITRITGILNAMKPFVHTTTVFNGCRLSKTGSNVSFPGAWTPIVGTNAQLPTPPQYPQFISWVGRDVNGIRVRYTLHGTPVAPDTDYRNLASETPAVNVVVNALSTGTPSLVTAGGTTPVINTYANYGYNAYFQRKRRKVA
jgi:hypothetical protein